jgi:uncharacterized protein
MEVFSPIEAIMHPEEFNPDQFPRGVKRAFDLQFAVTNLEIRIPVLVVRGKNAGKVLAVTAGVHGDEYEGIRAILDVYRSLDPCQMSGDLLAVPVANPLAFWGGTRMSETDGGNLARVFPGDLVSGPTAAIAHYLAGSIIRRGDFFLDLHSGGTKLLMPTMVGYDAQDLRSRKAALIFGATVLWAHPSIPSGRTISFAGSQGIPWLYTEARGGGRIHHEDLDVFERGLWNLLRHLSIVPGEPDAAIVKLHLFGDGNTDLSIAARQRGFFISSVELLQTVRHGEELGTVVDLHGEVVQTVRAPQDGVVVLVRQTPRVEPGEALFLLTDTSS